MCLSNMLDGFQIVVGFMRISDNSREGCEQGSVSGRIKVLRGVEAVNLKMFLTGLLETAL